MNRDINHQLLSRQYTPVFYRLGHQEQKKTYQQLISENTSLIIHDQMDGQLRELIKSLNPARKISPEEYPALIETHLNGTDINEYGVWVYYPWLNALVHLLDEEEFVEVRTNRNRYKITPEEQKSLAGKKIGVVGLSVGQSIALTLAMERTCGELRLADFDTAELSNLNRIRTGVQNLGMMKTVIAAREIAELDPFLKVSIFNDGLTKENVDTFFNDGGKLDLLVEVCDSLDVKIMSRYKARELRIPVVMDTNDRGMLDVERFDLEPDRKILHGFAGEPSVEMLETLNPQQRIGTIMKIVGMDTLSTRLKASMLEMNISINTWPQLASSVVLGGAITTDTCRRILLNEHTDSGRYYIDMDELIPGNKNHKKDDESHAPDSLTNDTIKNLVAEYFKTNERGSEKLALEQLYSITEAAIKTPSLYNSQPWKLAYSGNKLFVFHDPDNLDWTDGDDTHTYLALGALLENIHLQAVNLGLQDEQELFPISDGLLVSAIGLAKSEVKADTTDKKLTENPGMGITSHPVGGSGNPPLDFLEQIPYFVGTNPNLSIEVVKEKDEIGELADIIGSLERRKLLDENGHREFFNMLRWKDNGDGSGMKVSEFSGMEQAGFGMLKDRSVGVLLNKWGKGDFVKQMVGASMQSVAAVLSISVKAGNNRELINAGRSLQQIRIAANIPGILNQPVYIPAVWREENSELSGEGIEEIKVLKERFLKIFPLGNQYKRDYTNVLLMKLSTATETDSDELRKPRQEVLLEINDQD